MKSHLRENRQSASTRRKVDKIVELMRARDMIRRRVSRAWIPIRIRKDGDPGAPLPPRPSSTAWPAGSSSAPPMLPTNAGLTRVGQTSSQPARALPPTIGSFARLGIQRMWHTSRLSMRASSHRALPSRSGTRSERRRTGYSTQPSRR